MWRHWTHNGQDWTFHSWDKDEIKEIRDKGVKMKLHGNKMIYYEGVYIYKDKPLEAVYYLW